MNIGLKTKLIFYSREPYLIEIINRAALFGIDLNNSPIALYSSNVYPDLSEHLGPPILTQDGEALNLDSYRSMLAAS